MQQNPNLTDEQNRVLFGKGTEMPGSGALLDETRDGMYSCATCGGHLGHLFTGVDDHPSGNHYCINSCTLNFTPKETE